MKLIAVFCLALLQSHRITATNSEENALLLDSDDDGCDMMVCRAGRECRVDDNGEAGCFCLSSCPDHFVPICGSNGKSYDNYCLMHRDACLTGTHISLQSKGYCHKPKKSSKKKSNKKKKTEDDVNLFEPVVCFQWERDALRRQMLTYFRQHTADQSWYRPGLTHSEKIWARFYVCDTSQDHFLDANELLTCLKDVAFSLRTTADNNELVKALCVDAIVDSGDSNSDWRLDYEEFKRLVNSDFHPKEKLCSLDGKKYEDGSQTKVDCNDCVCACGSWVCTSRTCAQDQTNDIEELDEEEGVEDLDDDGAVEDEEVDDDFEDKERQSAPKILDIEEDDTNVDPDEDDIVNEDDLDDDEADEDDATDDDEFDSKKSKNKKSKTFQYSEDI